MNRLIVLILMGTILLFSQCKKEEENWTPCTDCELEVWVGTFDGSGVYYQEVDSTSKIDVATKVIIENTNNTMLKVNVNSDNLYSSISFVNKNNNLSYIELAGSNSSLSLTLTKKDNDYRLSGTSKKYHYDGDTLLVIDYSLSFEVLKVIE